MVQIWRGFFLCPFWSLSFLSGTPWTPKCHLWPKHHGLPTPHQAAQHGQTINDLNISDLPLNVVWFSYIFMLHLQCSSIFSQNRCSHSFHSHAITSQLAERELLTSPVRVLPQTLAPTLAPGPWPWSLAPYVSTLRHVWRVQPHKMGNLRWIYLLNMCRLEYTCHESQYSTQMLDVYVWIIPDYFGCIFSHHPWYASPERAIFRLQTGMDTAFGRRRACSLLTACPVANADENEVLHCGCALSWVSV